MESSIERLKIESDIKALEDVSVCLMVWTRPNLQRKQFDIIRKSKPNRLYIVSDCWRDDTEKALILESRNVVESVDWECEVVRYYPPENRGMYTVYNEISELIWKENEYCIFLEDDQIPSCSFVKFCNAMLKKYKTDTRVAAVCGYNYLNDCSDKITSDYFFANRYAIWGVAYWRRTVEEFKKQLPNISDKTVWDNIRRRSNSSSYGNEFLRRIKGYYDNDIYEGHVAGDEFGLYMANCMCNQVFIIPTRNMISNCGATTNSSHSDNIKCLPYKIQKLFCSRTYEVSNEIKHPDYMCTYFEFDKRYDDALLVGNILRNMYRIIVRGIRTIIWGDIINIIKRKIYRLEK